MNMLDGVNQCWPLAKDCVVWWDAWAVIVALAAVAFAAIGVAVAWLSFLVTGLSALAVFWLGKQANRIANSSHELATSERDRESRFLLAYMYSQLVEVHSEIVNWLERNNDFARDFFLASSAGRGEMLDSVGDLDLPTIKGHFDRMHVLETSLSNPLARAISALDLLRTIRERLRNPSYQRAATVSAFYELLREVDGDLRIVVSAAQADRDSSY